jgi:mRNA interferase MazF
MVDKVMTVPRSRLGERVGRLEDGTMQAVDEALMAFIGLT